MDGRYPPDDPRHVQEIIDHIAHLDDAQIDEIRATLELWEGNPTTTEDQSCHTPQQ